MVKVIQNHQKIVVKKVPIHTRVIVTLLLMGAVFMVAFMITYINKTSIFTPPSNYQECSALKSSVIQESYPAVCVTRDGKRFLQPIPEEEQKLLESPLESPIPSASGT